MRNRPCKVSRPGHKRNTSNANDSNVEENDKGIDDNGEHVLQGDDGGDVKLEADVAKDQPLIFIVGQARGLMQCPPHRAKPLVPLFVPLPLDTFFQFLVVLGLWLQ